MEPALKRTKYPVATAMTSRSSQFAAKSTTSTPTPRPPSPAVFARVAEQNIMHQQRDSDPEHSLEEVYICECCCVSRPLSSAMQLMPTFRCLFYMFNVFAFAFGFANLGMGLWFRIDPKVYEIHKYIETQNFTTAGWIILFGGFGACLSSLFGFLCATGQLAGGLAAYASVMIVLTLCYVAALVLLTVYGLGGQLENFLVKELYEQMRRRVMNVEPVSLATSDASQFLDFVQVKMKCCGAADFRDYGKLGMVVPTTCYAIDRTYISAPGCGRAIRRLLDVRAGMAIGFTTGGVLAQLAAIVMAVLMLCAIYQWRASPRRRPQLDPQAQRLTTPNPSSWPATNI